MASIRAKAIGSRSRQEVDVLDLAERVGTFDMVLFVGVIYHMRHPRWPWSGSRA